MLRAEVGDRLVGPAPSMLHGEIVGVIIQVHGEDGGSPFTVRWYDDGTVSKINPDPQRYWIRSHRTTHEVRITDEALHRVA